MFSYMKHLLMVLVCFLPIWPLSHLYFSWFTEILCMFCILSLWCYMFNIYCHPVRGLFHWLVFWSTYTLNFNVIELIFSCFIVYFMFWRRHKNINFYILLFPGSWEDSIIFAVKHFEVLLFTFKFLICKELTVFFFSLVWSSMHNQLSQHHFLTNLFSSQW